MKFSHLLYTLSLLVFVCSCSYRLVKVETIDGKKIWIKEYKDFDVAEIKKDQSVFKSLYEKQDYSIYTGQIDSDTTHGSTFVQFDSVRVYLFHGTSTHQSIFTSGLVSGQMLYCELDSSCKPTRSPFTITDRHTGEPIPENLWGWSGHTITIDHFEELKHVGSKPTQRRFKFWVYQYKIRFNGANDIFYLELTNKQARKDTDLETFVKGARVTFLKKTWMMI